MLPNEPNRNIRYRLQRFHGWLQQRHVLWYELSPALMTAYKTWLLEQAKLTPHNARLHLSAVCSHYRLLVEDKTTLTGLLTAALRNAPPSEAVINQVRVSLEAAIQPDVIKIDYKHPKRQPLHLTREQVERLLASPNRQTVGGLRDFAILCVLAGTGINDIELLALQVSNINSQEKGQPALHVPDAPGCTERLIPYGSLTWVQKAVQLWLKRAGIKHGPVFRSLRKNEKVRETAMTVQALYGLLKQYPVEIDGKAVPVTVMDLRRTYARHLYEHGVRLEDIQKLMGHGSLNTTNEYVGKAAKPPSPLEGIPVIYSINIPEG
jgi:site-specific recombinase XerD